MGDIRFKQYCHQKANQKSKNDKLLRKINRGRVKNFKKKIVRGQ